MTLRPSAAEKRGSYASQRPTLAYRLLPWNFRSGGHDLVIQVRWNNTNVSAQAIATKFQISKGKMDCNAAIFANFEPTALNVANLDFRASATPEEGIVRLSCLANAQNKSGRGLLRWTRRPVAAFARVTCFVMLHYWEHRYDCTGFAGDAAMLANDPQAGRGQAGVTTLLIVPSTSIRTSAST